MDILLMFGGLIAIYWAILKLPDWDLKRSKQDKVRRNNLRSMRSGYGKVGPDWHEHNNDITGGGYG